MKSTNYSIQILVMNYLKEKGWKQLKNNNRSFSKDKKNIVVLNDNFVHLSLSSVNIGTFKTSEVLDASNKLLQYFISY